MPSLPGARISHFTNHRLRLKVPEKRRDAPFFSDAAERLSSWDSIERVEINPLTASLLIHYTDPQQLFLEAVAKNDFLDIDFDTVFAQESGPQVMRTATRSFETADLGLRRWTQNRLDLRGMLFLLLLGGGLYQLLRGRLATPAPTLLWYAGDLLGLWSDRPENGARASG
jgi:hypothetical protein